MSKWFLAANLIICSAFIHFAHVEANGAVWNAGTVVGSLGPLKQSDLVLSRQHVIFHDGSLGEKSGVRAQFRIFNPTKRTITVAIGFPIDYSGAIERSGGDWKKQYDESYAKEFTVKVNGKKVPVSSSRDFYGVYSLMFSWDMTFLPRKTVEVVVEYPHNAYVNGGDGEGRSYYKKIFRYLTHTGAYWAKPIGQAVFEYCSHDIVGLMHRSPEKSESPTERGTTTSWRDETWWVLPDRYEVNEKTKCIVWKRAKWMPTKDDDIEVGKSVQEGSYSGDRTGIPPAVKAR